MFILSGKQRIFVSIAAYRDSEAPATVRDLLEKADRPHLVKIGILNQICPKEDIRCKVGGWTNVQERIVDYTESKGACWARSYIWTNLLEDEDFVLQIDSHSRFDHGWDTTLLKTFEKLQDASAVLTHYPMRYDPLTNVKSAQMYTRFDIQSFNQYGFPVISSAALALKDAPVTPAKTAFIAGGCLFTRARTIKNVPYDPHLYFQGEEINYAIRVWTHGHNLYLPNKPFMYHDYGNGRARRMHWQDVQRWKQMNELSIMRNKHVLDLGIATDPASLIDIDKYSLGKHRTLSDWERFSGVYLRAQTLTEKAKTGSFQ